MIPKIIHYTWFSGDPFPPLIKQCIDSWHKYLPDYSFVCWDSARIKEIQSIWLEETLSVRKWAFASDFVRLYALFHYGGIYLDTDCLLYNTLNSFLSNECFIGKENSIHVEGRSTQMYLTSHCFGAEKHNPFIKKCLSYYDNQHFILSKDDALPTSLKYNMLLLPYIQSEIAKQIGYNAYPSCNVVQKLEHLTVYPSCYFDTLTSSSNSYCRHMALGAWRDSKTPDEKPTIKYKIRWRIERIVNKLCDKFGYYLIKKL